MKRIIVDWLKTAASIRTPGLFLLWFLCSSAMVRFVSANEPPRPGEIEYLKETGQFGERLDAAKAIGNHMIDPDRLSQAIYRAKREAMMQQGASDNEALPAPPGASNVLPSKGSVKVFALLIDFLDYPGYSTCDQIQSSLFGDGSLINTNRIPYESLRNYYQRSSYGQLDFSSGTTLGWYHAPYARSAVTTTTVGRENLIKEALAALGSSDNFAQFDNDGNGQIEYFMVIWTGPNNGWSNFWWGYQTSFSDSTFTLNGKRLGRYSWQWEGYYGAYGPFNPQTVIHETGHALGLPDLYDYDSTTGPNGAVGGLDIMDGNWGDHNCFSKWVLDWLTPTVIGTQNQTLVLNPSGASRDAVVIGAGALVSDPFSEFFMVQNRYRTGNDVNYPADGMLIWHVDASLNPSGTGFLYNNSYSSHKLLMLMQADGLDRIEQSSIRADADMYYEPGDTFGSATRPSSKNHMGTFTRAHVADIVQNGSQLSAVFSIEDAGIGSTLTVVKEGPGSGTVTGNDGGISCGSDCAESYLNGDTVTLTAVAAPGSDFAGWSGGGCSGIRSCVLMLSANTTVSATFNSTLILDEDFDPEFGSPPAGWSTWWNSGNAYWWFTYDRYNTSGGTGESALGATSASSQMYDTELRTPVLSLSRYNSVGLEFKTSLESSGETADVDVSVNGAVGPWTTIWKVSGVSRGPRTIQLDLTSVVAASDNVMLRFHLYGTSIWWVIDDIKVMATTVSRNPAVVLSADSLNFGRQAVGVSSASQGATLTNNGTGTLSIVGISIGGTHANDFTQTNDCGNSLAEGGLCTVRVVFKPGADGTRTASLKIVDNATGSPHEIALIGNGSSIVTENAYHVFPQIADGYLGDGSYYRSTVIVTNANPGTSTPSCTLQFHGLSLGGQSAIAFTVSSVYLYSSPGNTEALKSGYASLQCSSNVEAQLLYSEYSHAGIKLSEATVFSSPPQTSLRIVADERGGSQLGLALANDSTQPGRYTINVYNSNGTLVGSSMLAVDAGQNRALFLDQLATVPSNYLGVVDVVATSGTASLIGVRYTGICSQPCRRALWDLPRQRRVRVMSFPRLRTGISGMDPTIKPR